MLQSIAPAIQQNTLVNQVNTTGVPRGIANAIQTAANQTGVDFSYLLKKASQESSFNPNVKASTSSATGLYQFTQQTWLQMVKSTGSKYGLGKYADQIQTDNNGVAHVKDPTWRQAILNLRKDPTASAEMAGELDKQNQQALQDNVGGKVGGTELYLAHFLGAGGASTFLNNMQTNPKQAAANVLPQAAAANPAVFYGKDGSPRSLQQIYQHFAQKFDSATSPVMVASANSNTFTPSSTPTPTLAAPMTVASAVPYSYGTSYNGVTSISPTATSTTIAVNGVKAEGSSLMATMILAQMPEQGSASTAANGTHQNNKKSVYDLLNLGAVG